MRTPFRSARRSATLATAIAMVAAAGILLTACSSSSTGTPSSSSPTSISFQLDWVKNSEFAGLFMADEKGYYKAQGLKVNFLDGSNVASTAAVIAGGGAQIGIVSNLSRLAEARKSGADLVAVGAIYQTSPAGFMTASGKKLTSAKDLKGLKIGTDASGVADIDALFTVNGLTPDYTAVQVGYDAAPLFQGTIDAYYAYLNSEPIPYQLKGDKFNTVTFAKLGFKSYAGLIVTTRKYLTEHRAVVEGFVSASMKGWKVAMADPTTAAKTTIADYGKSLGLDQPTEVAILKAQTPLMQSSYTDSHGLLAMDPAEITGPMDAALTAAKEKVPALKSAYDFSLVKDANAAAGK